MTNSLKDIKAASSKRQAEQNDQAQNQSHVVEAAPAVNTSVSEEKTKMLSFRVPRRVHREFQRQLFEAQELYPNLTAQETMPAIVRTLRDPDVWRRFLKELEGRRSS